MDQEQIKRICLEVMAPMVEEFAKEVAKMREEGATDADMAAMLDRVESDNRGEVDGAVLEVISLGD
jgi:hypothetical protein